MLTLSAACSQPCNTGTQARSRTIVTNGAMCGALTDSQACNTQPCDVACVVSAWSAWGSCSVCCAHTQCACHVCTGVVRRRLAVGDAHSDAAGRRRRHAVSRAVAVAIVQHSGMLARCRTHRDLTCVCAQACVNPTPSPTPQPPAASTPSPTPQPPATGAPTPPPATNAPTGAPSVSERGRV
jgi:hypothetical protein